MLHKNTKLGNKINEKGEERENANLGQSFSEDYFKGLKYWAGLSKAPVEQCTVIYNGENNLSTSNSKLLSINNL